MTLNMTTILIVIAFLLGSIGAIGLGICIYIIFNGKEYEAN